MDGLEKTVGALLVDRTEKHRTDLHEFPKVTVEFDRFVSFFPASILSFF